MSLIGYAFTIFRLGHQELTHLKQRGARKDIISLVMIFLISPVFASQAPKFTQPQKDPSEWKNTFFVLLKDDASIKKTQKVIEKYLAKDVSNMPFGVFKKNFPQHVSTLLPMGNGKSHKKGIEDARSKLGRYLVVRYPDSVNLAEVFEDLKNDIDVAYFSVDESTPVVSHSGNYHTITGDSIKFWGHQKVRASDAHAYQHGHSFVGVADLGLDPNHPEFEDYTGNTWKGGNFHPALAFNIARTVIETPSQANPYSGYVDMGNVDGYHLGIISPWDGSTPDSSTCDEILLDGMGENIGGNDNGTLELVYVGHGSHVTGILAANSTNGIGVNGVCAHCPLAIGQYNFPTNSCETDRDYYQQTVHPDGSPFEGYSNESAATVFASMGMLIDIGVQVLNYSGGIPISPTFCTDDAETNEDDLLCLLIQYAVDRDVIVVASAGNYNAPRLHYPAGHSAVFGVSGIGIDGNRWTDLPNGDPNPLNNHPDPTVEKVQHGSNFGTNSTNGPTFAGPAEDIYSTFYSGKTYNRGWSCEDMTDGDNDDGYGYCTGTSMAAPFISGVAALVRSTNPLMDVDDVREVMKDSTTQSGYNNELGYGVPRADYAVKDTLGKSGFQQVLNRVTPLFSMYSSVAGDIAQTTKPQVAAAYHLNTFWGYVPHSSETLVSGYTFPESAKNPTPPAPRADIFILTTHRLPAGVAGLTTPLYRMRWVHSYGGNPNDADWTLALESEISGSLSFKAVGYEMDGMEGYIYQNCSAEPSCIPTGAVKIHRAYNPQKDDHAVFLDSEKSNMQAIGYTDDVTQLGYAYPNVDSDLDGLIDGMEHILGTDINEDDSDCDNVDDAVEYPLTGIPVSDPMNGFCGGGPGGI